MSSKVDKDQLTDKQRADYLESLLIRINNLIELIEFLKSRRTFADPDETRFITAHLGDLASQMAKLERERDLFYSAQIQIVPPTEEQIQKIKDVSAKVDALIAQNDQAKRALKLAGDLMKAYNSQIKTV